MGTRYKGTKNEILALDTFTKLIFGVEDELSSQDLLIIRALRMIDDNIALDDHTEMGVYLRALGVNEMIKLVAQVRRCFPLSEQAHTRGVSGLRAVR